jgi:hypothetical protein
MFNLFNLFPTEIQQEKAPLLESSKQLLSKQVFTTGASQLGAGYKCL